MYDESMLVPVTHSSWLIPAAKEAYKSREQIAGAWDRIVTRIKGKKLEIAVTGLNGAGKTVLLDHLTGAAFHRGYVPPGRSRSSEKGQVRAKGFRLGLSTIPGQGSHIRLTAIAKIFESKRPVEGVIHVVSNGYISLRETAARETLLRDLGISTVEKIRQHFLQEELRDLDETLGLIRKSLKKSHKPTWLIVAVAKSDLFYDRMADAEQYYSPSGNSAFAEKMRQFLGQVGSDNFGWEAVPVAAWLEDFQWGSETLPSQLKPDHAIITLVFLQKSLRKAVEADAQIISSEFPPDVSPADPPSGSNTSEFAPTSRVCWHWRKRCGNRHKNSATATTDQTLPSQVFNCCFLWKWLPALSFSWAI